MALAASMESVVSNPGATWDVLVVGAGPAGAVAARQLAQRGAAVLLVDKAKFPRQKVCGCCINAGALQMLQAIGLHDRIAALGGTATRRLQLHARGRQLRVAIPPGLAVSRRAFDWALVKAAVASGVTFRPSTSASLAVSAERFRCVQLRRGADRETVAARLVLAADGLNGRLLAAHTHLRATISGSTRIGAAVILDAGGGDYRSGTIYMACGRGGYVGLVRLEDGSLNVAAAFDPAWVKQHGGPGAAAKAVLAHARLPAVEHIERQPWRGTAGLTRRRALGDHRLLVLGDAAGYVEPFTGEGMLCALASAQAIVEPALSAVVNWHADLVRRWTALHRRLIDRRQLFSRLLRWPLRHPVVVAAAIECLRRVPIMVRPFVGAVHAPLSIEQQRALFGKVS